MPMTIDQHRASLHQPAFSELLPVRDILNDVIIRTTGALVAGYELSGINSYYHNDDGRNRTKLALEALIRSLPERSMRMQVRFEIAEGLGDLRERYQQQLRNQNPTLLALDRMRIDAWRKKEHEGYYLRPLLHAYFHWNPTVHHELPGATFGKAVTKRFNLDTFEATVWAGVQQILQRNGSNGGSEVRDSYGALMKGLLHCATCHARMMRTYSTQDSRRHHHYVCTEAQKRGANCHVKAVSEPVIKAAVIRQIRGIGSDPRVVARAVIEAEEQRRGRLAELASERQAAQRELASLCAELRNVTKAGCSDQWRENDVADLRERIDKTEHRLKEILQGLGGLELQEVDEGDIRTALARFGPVWESLNSREQVRILETLIDRVVYSGKTNNVTVIFRSAGIREVCRAPRKEDRRGS